MRAAIYARKSNDDNDKNADNKSVTRQVEHGKAYAERHAWTVDEEHVFIDDGISGANFTRPGLLRMLTRLKEFDLIVMSELSRLGRDQWQTGKVLADVQARDVRVFFYLTDDELNFDSAVDRFMVNAVAFAAELEREKASQRSRDALLRRAERGYNTGGRCYGYNNVPVTATNASGEEVRSHTDFRINEEQAKVVRGIFRMYADGSGMTVIAKTLNGEPKYRDKSLRYFEGMMPTSPASGTKKGTGSWAPSSVRAILHNERYMGKVPFGRYRKTWKGGSKRRVRQDEFKQVLREDLVVVPPELWGAVHRRLKAARESYIRDTGGTLFGRPESGRESKYLLSGLARCDVCGRNMVVTTLASGPLGGRRRHPHYICNYHRQRGATVCPNSRKPRVDEMDGIVLDAIEQQILTPDVVREVIARSAQQVAERLRGEPDVPRKLRATIGRLRSEVGNLVTAIAAGNGAAQARLTAEIESREARIAALEIELARYETPVDVAQLDSRRLQRKLRERLGRFRELLRSNVPKARQVLRKLLSGPIWLIPSGDGKDYVLRGETRLGALLPSASTQVASPTGFEPVLPP